MAVSIRAKVSGRVRVTVRVRVRVRVSPVTVRRDSGYREDSLVREEEDVFRVVVRLVLTMDLTTKRIHVSTKVIY